MALDPTTVEGALTMALILNIVAPDDEQAATLLGIATQIAAGLDKATITACYMRAQEELGVLR